MTDLPFISISNKMLPINLVCLALISTALAMFPSSSDVIELTDSNFNKLVQQSDDVWVVEFYAPWCGHCQQLAPEYTKAAKGLKGVVKVGAVNCDVEKSLPGRYGIRGFPTIKIFGVNKNKPEEFKGNRNADDIVTAALKELKNKIFAAMGMKKESGDSKDVVELTDSNFESLVLKSEDMWLVEFYAPWCGHCKNLAPQWADAATELKGKVKLGALDATVHTIKANEFSVKGYPTIKYFPPGSKDKTSAEDYTGDRTASGIVSWALEKLAMNVPPPEIKQILNADTIKSECELKPLCVISVLPHILDCNASCRNAYIAIMTAAGEKFKNKMWGWVWSEAGQQPNLESALDIGGFGYPAMAVLNAKKMKYSLFKGAFSKDGVNEFLRDLSYGRGSTAPVRGAKIPDIVTQTIWDGKDGELPQEEDIDLSDVDLGDEPKDEL